MGTLVALTWVLLTSHCKLEGIPGFEFLHCATDIHEAAESETGGDPCEDSGCCSFESAQYHATRQQEIAPTFVSAFVPPGRLGVVENRLPDEIRLGIPNAAPPELSSSWRFVSRAALPPRAPCPAS